MKKLNIKESFKEKHFKRGSYSAGMIVIVIAIVIVVNLVVSQLPSGFISIDLSGEHYFSLGSQTKKLVKDLDTDVTVYQVVAEGKEDTITTKLLDKYKELSDHIKISKIDPDLNPSFLQKYSVTDLEDNSLIVESGLRYKVVNASDIYEYAYDSSYYTTGTYSSADYDGEGEITSAIDYVVTEDIPNLYTLTGNGEQELSTSMTDAVKKENFQVNELSLIETGTVPEDCDVLAILAPSYDLSGEEANAVIDYLKAGGSAIIVNNYNGKDMTNFNTVLEAYGMQIEAGYVVEGNSNRYYSHQLYLLPEIGSHAITDPIASENLYLMIPCAQPITEMDSVRSTLTFEDLLTTTEDSYTVTDYGKDTNLTKTSDSKKGPFTIAKAVSEEVDNGTSKLVVFTSYYPFTDDITQQYTPANITLFTNSLNWMSGHESTVNIDAKSLDVDYNTISSAAMNTWTAVFVVMIPLVVVVCGLVVWIRRRKA